MMQVNKLTLFNIPVAVPDQQKGRIKSIRAIRQRFHFVSIVSSLLIIMSAMNVQAQHSFSWVKGIGGSNQDWGRGVAVDGMGNVYIVGSIDNGTSPIEFNPGGVGGSLTPVGRDVYLTKYDGKGTYLWAKNLGSSGAQEGYGIALDEGGNIYIAGHFYDTMYFERGINPQYLVSERSGRPRMFVAKYDTDGNYIWARSGGPNLKTATGYTFAYGIAVDTKRNGVYVTGGFLGEASFVPEPGLEILASLGNAKADYDIYLAKYDTSGNYLWVNAIRGTSNNYGGEKVAIDSYGDVYLTGSFKGTADFDPGSGVSNLLSSGGLDAFIAKYRPDGSYVWSKNIGGTGDDLGKNITIDNLDNIYLTGSFALTANFNPGSVGDTLTSAGGSDVFLAKYDTLGNYTWSKRMGGDDVSYYGVVGSGILGQDHGHAVTTDGVGNIYVSGSFSGMADFNPGGSGGVLTSAGGPDMFITKRNREGVFIWAKRMGSNDAFGFTTGDYGTAIALNRSGDIYASGFYSGSADFNPGGAGGTVNKMGLYDVFLLKLSCSDTSVHHISITACESYTLNGETYTEEGTYIQRFPNAAGCDSIITIELTFDPHEKPIINVNEFVLGVSGTYRTYQWIKNGVDIPGATESTLTVTENADYQIRVTNENGCIITSDVYTVTNVSIEELNSLAQFVSLYPNPARDEIYISAPVKVNIRIMDMAGRLIKEQANATSVSIAELASGNYLLSVSDRQGAQIKMLKLVKTGVAD